MDEGRETANQNISLIAPPEISPEQAKWQLNPEDVLNLFEQDLRGNSFDYNLKIWKRAGKPKMNGDGIREIMSTIKIHINKVTFLSNLNAHDIQRICTQLHLDIARILFFHQKDYEVEIDDMDMILDKTMNIIYIGLKKSLDEGERKFFKKTMQIKERTMERERPRGIRFPF